MNKLIVALAAAAVLLCGSATTEAAPTREAVIVPGKSIGKVELGMTFAQVKRILGRPNVINSQRRVGFGRYVEYDWGWGRWTVGFTGRGNALRVSLVATSVRRERTRERIGVGSTRDALVSTYRPRGLRCETVDRIGSILDTPVCRLGDARSGETWFPFQKVCTAHPPPRTIWTCPTEKTRVEVFEILIRNGNAPRPEYA